MPTPQTSLRIDPAIKAAAQRRCADEDTTLTAVIEQALADYAAGRWPAPTRCAGHDRLAS